MGGLSIPTSLEGMSFDGSIAALFPVQHMRSYLVDESNDRRLYRRR